MNNTNYINLTEGRFVSGDQVRIKRQSILSGLDIPHAWTYLSHGGKILDYPFCDFRRKIK